MSKRAIWWRAAMAALLLVAVGAAQERAASRVTPFFELRLENDRVFTRPGYSTLFAGIADVAADRFGIRDAGPRAKLDGMLCGLDWPLEVMVMYESATSTPIGGIWTPARARPLLPDLLAMSAHDTAAQEQLEHGGAEFVLTHLRAGADQHELTVCEGVPAAPGDRRLLLLGPAEAMPRPLDTVDALVAQAMRRRPASRVLERHARGGDVGWIFHLPSLLQSMGQGERGLLEPMIRLMVGSRFAGLAGRVRAGDDALAFDLFADLRPGYGWLGTLLQREPRALSLIGWIPGDSTEYLALDLSVDGMVRGLRQLGLFGERLTPATFVDELDWLGRVDLEELLDTHFTGQVIVAREAGIDTGLAGPNAAEGVVFGLEVFDGPRLLAETQERVNGEDGEPGARIEEAFAVGPGVHTAYRGGEPFLHLAVTPRAVFAALANPAGAAMLRKCLASGGRGRLPAVPRADGAPDRLATMIGQGHVMRHVLDVLDTWRPRVRPVPQAVLVGEPDPPVGAPPAEVPDAVPAADLSEALERFLAEHDGLASWRLVVDRDGARLHVEL